MKSTPTSAAQSEQWLAVDAWFSTLFSPSDDMSDKILVANHDAGLPEHDISIMQGKTLAFFITLMQAQRILEIGTLGAFSTIWMARSLPPGGRVTTIEAEKRHAEVALHNVSDAGLCDRVDLRIGQALDILPSLKGPFDLIFIDADKKNNPAYLEWALRLSRSGTLIIADNIVRGGEILQSESSDDNVKGVRTFLSLLAKHPLLTATAIQTVGSKGWDGFALAVVTGNIDEPE
ncbi:O-methyltransferase [Klebsiella aerogenes]|uniref:O-methyltransferase n=1 Tax=Klebsiella aerogenes TaxID=548 RepID=UPI0027DD4994|nr:O-methyltransferase [Klebsiella aerogenes]